MLEVRLGSEGGETFVGWLQPASTRGPGVVLLQEIFGVNSQIRSIGRRFADLGYPTLAPDLFWRSEPRVNLGYSEADRAVAFNLYRSFDVEVGVKDVGLAVDVMKSHPSCDGRVAILGYCMGGLLAVLAGARHDPSAVVAYYGVGIDQHLDDLIRLTCPSLLHFGSQDSHIPQQALGRIRAATKAMSNIEVAIYRGAGHAFANEQRTDLYQRDSALLADERTLKLLIDAFD
ncbi:dienelactone hydrolase family protein [Paraburkholderia sediminicola]|uniref:dienelactone hydrolase family protein n=1 Tax=Paraburkholderia sediminicola TaxID=458836 RepID=UPI0038BDA4CB